MPAAENKRFKYMFTLYDSVYKNGNNYISKAGQVTA